MMTKSKNSFILFILSIFLFNLSYAQVEDKAKASEPTTQGEQAESETTSAENSLLWEISGNGLETPSYLFGTIHMIAADDFFLTDVMKEKFAETKKLVLELDMDDPTMLFSAFTSMMMKNGTTLKDLLTAEEYQQVSAHFKKMGLPMFMFNRILPLITSTMVMEAETSGGTGGLSSGSMKSYEMEFMDMAKGKEMDVAGLETVKDQLSVFDSIPYKAQAKMLMDALNGEGDMGATTFDDMVELYKKQDLNGLYKLISEDSSDMQDYEDVLLVKRNKNWIPKISEMAAVQPTFFAVGAGHLPGKYGVINLLKEAGYTLTPIK